MFSPPDSRDRIVGEVALVDTQLSTLSGGHSEQEIESYNQKKMLASTRRMTL